MTKSPSKYLSIKRLEEIKANGYHSKDGKIYYCPEEVDSLIWEKREAVSFNIEEYEEPQFKSTKEALKTLPDGTTAIPPILTNKGLNND